MDARGDLARIFRAAVSAVEPAALTERWLQSSNGDVEVGSRNAQRVSWRGPTLVVGAGKAAVPMAIGCERRLGPEMVRGLVITTARGAAAPQVISVTEAGHPLPDRRGLQATEQICDLLLRNATEPVLCLISGGASSLLVRPRPPITLRDKIEATRLLYGSGADIYEVNTVRKHLSEVKGGGLLRFARGRPVVTLILSDVIGDDPAVIGSGPTEADASSFEDAEAILERHDIAGRLPATVRSVLAAGRRGEEPETVKPGDAATDHVFNFIVGSNRTALQAAADEAKSLGYEVLIDQAPLCGDTTVAARQWIGRVLTATGSRSGPTCVVAGGETTVRVTGSGKGGRNQEFALAVADRLAGSDVTFLSAGTDGIDGPTEAAGAFADGGTAGRAAELGLDPLASLRANDSYSFFARLGDLFRPGLTGTNVMDIKLALAP